MGLKRLGAAIAALMIVGVPGLTQAATLRALDQDGLNLRSGPGTSHQLVGALSASDSAVLLGEENGWFKVRTASGAEGWASGLFSRINYEDEQADAIVNTDVLNVRKQPGLGAPILTQLKQNDRVRLLERLGDWWRVRLGNSSDGWVAAQYIKRADTAPTPAPPVPTPPPTSAPPTSAPPTPPAPTPPPPSTPGPSPVPQVQPAPASAVPVLPVVAPPAPLPLGSKTVTVRTATGVYSGRDTGAFDRVDSVQPGNSLTYLGAAEGWVKVRTGRGTTGWIPGQSVQVTEGQLAYALAEGRWNVSIGGQPAPAPPAAAPAPAPGALIERRGVRDADGLRVRSAPALDGAILAVLAQGDDMDVLETRAPWLRVVSSGGKTGWVHGDYTVVLPSRTATPAPAPAPAPPPFAAGTLNATIQATDPGVLRVEITSRQATIGKPTVDGTTLMVPVPTGQGQTAILPIGADGASHLSVTPSGILLSLEKTPGWRVLEQAPGKLVIEIRPTVIGIALTDAPDRTVYSFRATGSTAPRASAAGANVFVDFAGAVIGLDAPAPAGLQVEQTATGVRVTVPSRRAYSLKRTAQGVELHLYRPGLAGKTIMLDPGHGGSDPGASNAGTGVQEKTINLQVALRLRSYLVAKGANVLMTRATDTLPAPAAVLNQGGTDRIHIDLAYRTRMANELAVDSFLSIHHNAGDAGGGTESWYSSGTLNGGLSAELARLLERTVPAPLGQRDRGAKDDLMYVTRNSDAPAVLFEVAFLDGKQEQYRVADPAFQDKVAGLLAQALEQFYVGR